MENWARMIEQVREKQPLIHNITNQVVMNFTANGLYAMGASPVMAHAKEEVEDMARIANAVVLNIGTLTQDQVDAMILAGKAANQVGIPVVLDPVGVGATPLRTKSAERIIREVKLSIIRGNAGEIASLAGVEAEVRGVDSEGEFHLEQLAEAAFHKWEVPVAITGAQDLVYDGSSGYLISNGHPLLSKVTGTGCLLTSVIASFLAVEGNVLQAAASAISYYGIAAEKAADKTRSPGSFAVRFLDELHDLMAEEVEERSKVTYSQVGEDRK
ncbi:hydroxyethylthiazole kinase [Gracilibacillus sp. YIM 98692]|uniref:hydroxyethylthiazole kinase n=1 Tax=Gracilibacillus sp. YIM 98692 TaxID=2663532 RepID=UPI0013D40E05|nr:hydroxyethylthiazole kinase [Gracilibacillus sp. YIM 98692]